MKIQDISDKPYNDYIDITCSDFNKDEVIEALDMLWSYPPGKEKIIQVATRNGVLDTGTKLEIAYDSSFEDLVMVFPEEALPLEESDAYQFLHRITLSPYGLGICESTDGNQFEPTLFGLLAHELYHAADPELNIRENMLFQARFEYMRLLANEAHYVEKIDIIDQYIADNFDELPHDDKQKAIEDIYDTTDCAGTLMECALRYTENARHAFKEDKNLGAYIQKYETPAMDFANDAVAYANQYRAEQEQEPQRISDYSDSIMQFQAEKMPETTFTPFVLSLIGQIHEAGGIEHYKKDVAEEFAHQKQHCQQMIWQFSIPKNHQETALVRMEDTPQATISHIEMQGKMMDIRAGRVLD